MRAHNVGREPGAWARVTVKGSRSRGHRSRARIRVKVRACCCSVRPSLGWGPLALFFPWFLSASRPLWCAFAPSFPSRLCCLGPPLGRLIALAARQPFGGSGGGGHSEPGAGRAGLWFRLGSGVWPLLVAKVGVAGPWGRVWGSLRHRVPPVWLGVDGGVAGLAVGRVWLSWLVPRPTLAFCSSFFFARSRLSWLRPFVLGGFGGYLPWPRFPSYGPGLSGALSFPLTWPLGSWRGESRLGGGKELGGREGY